MKPTFSKRQIRYGWAASGALLASCLIVNSCIPPLENEAKTPTASSSSAQAIQVSLKTKEGLDALRAKDLPKAKELLTAARAETPQDPQVPFYLGIVEQELGNKPEAIRHYRDAWKLSPTSLEVAINLSALLLDTRKKEDAGEAANVAEAALKNSPDSKELLGILAVALVDIGDLTHAAPVYEKLIAKTPQDYRTQFDYANVLAKLGQKEKAVAALEPVGNSDDPKVLTAAGTLYTQLGAFQQCITTFDKVILKGPTPDLLVRRGNCKRALKDFKSERADYEQAISLDPNYAAAHLGLGKLLHYVEGKDKDALPELQKAQELGAGTPIAADAEKTIGLLKLPKAKK